MLKYEGSVDSALEMLLVLKSQDEVLLENGRTDQGLLDQIKEHETFIQQYYEHLERNHL